MRKLQYLGLAGILAAMSSVTVGCGDDAKDDSPAGGSSGSGGKAGTGTGGSSTGGSSTGGSSTGGTGTGGTGTGGTGTGGTGTGGTGTGGTGTGGTGTGGTGTGGTGGAPVVCPATPTGTPEALPGDINADMTLDATKLYELATPGTFVNTGATLTIPPCTTVVGGAQSALVIARGGKIMAVGDKDRPIVFTSKKDKGTRAPGDWGGLVILGRAAINQPGGEASIEGLSPNDTRGTYGGGTAPDNADSSGQLKYVRVEFNGFVYGKDNELNGVTFGAVGSGTQVDHVMVNNSADDGFEWFGGAVNASNLIVNDNKGDDLFDTDFGFSGTVSHFLGRKAGFGGDDKDPNGFEWDNDAKGNDYTPYTNGTFAKGTLCGKDLTAAPSGSYAAVLRRRTHGAINDTVLIGWTNGIDLRDPGTLVTATNSTFIGTNLVSTTDDPADGHDEAAWWNGGTGNNLTDPGFSADDCFSAPDSAAFKKMKDSGKGAFTGDAAWLDGAWTDWSDN